MNIADAWRVLGREWADVIRDISSPTTSIQRVERAESLLSYARKVAQQIMVENHPDHNPGNDDAAIRFMTAQEALRVIEYNTKSMRTKLETMQEKIAKKAASDGYIIIK
jgi:hypothetical protein